jgi:hypothetical protein
MHAGSIPKLCFAGGGVVVVDVFFISPDNYSLRLTSLLYSLPILVSRCFK